MPWQISQVWESLQKLFLIDGALFYCISLKKYFSIRIILIDAEIWLKKSIIYSYMSVEVSDKCFKTPIITSCIALQSCSKKKIRFNTSGQYLSWLNQKPQDMPISFWQQLHIEIWISGNEINWAWTLPTANKSTWAKVGTTPKYP